MAVQLGETEIATIGPGGFAGEMGLSTGSPRNTTVVAKSPTRVLHIDSRSFDGVLDDAPQTAVAMLPVVARRVVEDDTRHSDRRVGRVRTRRDRRRAQAVTCSRNSSSVFA